MDISYDLIYSRDAFLHIENKSKLFKKIKTLLNENGLLMFTDYCFGNNNNHSREFKNYLKNRKYYILKIEDYKNIVERSGFVILKMENDPKKFKYYLRSELGRLGDSVERFLKYFSEFSYSSNTLHKLPKLFSTDTFSVFCCIAFRYASFASFKLFIC